MAGRDLRFQKCRQIKNQKSPTIFDHITKKNPCLPTGRRPNLCFPRHLRSIIYEVRFELKIPDNTHRNGGDENHSRHDVRCLKHFIPQHH